MWRRLRLRGVITRRGLLAAGVAGGGWLLAGCGGAPNVDSTKAPAELVLARSPLGRADPDPAEVAEAVAAVTGFTAELYRRVAGQTRGNVVCSPYSVAQALAMTVQGARGDTAVQMLRVLHAAAGAATLGAGLGGLDATLARRTGRRTNAKGSDGQVVLAAANSVWGQRGLAWQRPFLDTLARDFGAGVRQVDFATATEPARLAINRWVSDQTLTRIPELVAPGLLDALTRLVLVNALYLKAPWHSPFSPEDTRKAPFTRLDGSRVTADLMAATVTDAGYARGDGWTAVDLPYAGKELAMAVILPDPGRFTAVESGLDAAGLARTLRALVPTGVSVDLPKWTHRTKADLADTLAGLGMPLAFTDRADFTGMTTADRLHISAVAHEGFIAVDEHGTEAAAATAVVMGVSAALGPPVSITVDRPFLYVIHDVATGAPLFTGRVTDPTTT